MICYPDIDLVFLSFHLFPILEVLLVYHGLWSYQVGKMIGKIVVQFKDKRPDLLDILQKSYKDYSNILKIIGFEEELQVSCVSFDLELFLNKLIIDSLDGRQVACLCLKTLLEKAFTM